MHTNVTEENQLVTLKHCQEAVVIKPGQTINDYAISTTPTDEKPTAPAKLKKLGLYREAAKTDCDD